MTRLVHFQGNALPVRRSKASTYLSRVFATTSSGSGGGGLALSQPVVSSQSRTNCLSNDGCGPPGRYDLLRPVPRAVGREHFVDQQQLAGLRRQTPTRTWCRPGSGRGQRRGRRRSDRPPGSSIVTFPRPPCRRTPAMDSNETFSSWPVSALVAGVKIGSIGSLSTSPGGSADAADRSRGAIFLPRTAGEIARTTHSNGTTRAFRTTIDRPRSDSSSLRAQIKPGGVDVGRDQVVGDLQEVEPVHARDRSGRAPCRGCRWATPNRTR